MLKNGDSKLEISFLLLNNNKQIIHFYLSPAVIGQQLFLTTPQIGGLFEETISPQHNIYLSYLLQKSVDQHSIMVDSYRLNYSDSLLVVIPLLTNEDLVYTVFTVITGITPHEQPAYDQNYARFTSHILRSPISNLLALSDVKNHNLLDSYTENKVEELLKAIYNQAIKLNDIVSTLNAMNCFKEEENNEHPAVAPRNIKAIMLVDDDAIVNKLHQYLLEKTLKQASVTAFEYPKDALVYLETNQPDIILLDINMPEINGWAFLDKLTERGITTDVVMITSSQDPKEKKKALAYNCVKGFVSKPLSADKITSIFNLPSQ